MINSNGQRRMLSTWHAFLALLLLAAAVSVVPASVGAQDAAGLDEATSGEFSDDGSNPTVLEVAPGSNVLSGSVAAGDIDYVTFTVPPGYEFSSLNILDYDSTGNSQSFIGIQAGSVFTESATDPNPANLLGFTLFGDASVGGDILQDIGSGPDTQGFSGALPSGDYTFWIQETSSLSQYYLDVTLTLADDGAPTEEAPVEETPAGDAVQFTFENLQPADGFFFTEAWVGLHDGDFDLFNNGERATPGLEALAEGGNTELLGTEFAQPGRLQTTIGNGEVQFISPGEVIEGSIDIRNASAYRYFSFASMIIPSNDAFFGNEDPFAYELFDADGNFTGPVTIEIFASDIYDSGTEVNDGQGAAGFSLGLNGDGGTSTDDTESTVGIHPDLLANIENFQTAAGTVVTDLLTPEEPVAVITVDVGDSINTQSAVGPLFDGSVVEDAAADVAPPAVEGMVFAESSQSFEDTLDALVDTIEANPNLEIAGIVDHAANAESVDLELDPNTVVIFGNPNIGTPLIAANPLVGIDLPIRLQVIDTDGQVFVGFNDATFLTDRHGIDGLAQLDTVATALRAITEAGTGPDQVITETSSESFVDDSRLTTVASDADFETTFDRLVGAIEASPANLFMVVDHAANAASVDLELDPNRVLFFGNPNIGTPLIDESPTAGFDLPLRALVWEDADGTVMVTTNSIELYTERHGVIETDLTMVNGALNNFLTAASTTPEPADPPVDDAPTDDPPTADAPVDDAPVDDAPAGDADPAPGSFRIVDGEFNRYLQASFGNASTTSVAHTTTEWDVIPTGDGAFYIQNAFTRRFLDADGSNVGLADSSDEGIRWTLEDAGDGSYYIVNEEFGTLLNADRPGFNVNTSSDPAPSSRWTLVPTESGTFPDSIALPDGFTPEGITLDGTTGYVGSLTSGAIQQIDVRTGESTEFAPATNDGGPTIGLAVDNDGRLWAAAGGPVPGLFPDAVAGFRVYDTNTGELLVDQDLPNVGLVNDIWITSDAAWLTDSFSPNLIRVPIAEDGTIGEVELVAIGGEWVQPEGFGANGIVATPDEAYLIVAQATGPENDGSSALFVLPLDSDATSLDATRIQLDEPLLSGDGLVLDGGTLYAVGGPGVTEIELSDSLTSGAVQGVLTVPGGITPTTADAFSSQLYVVDANFPAFGTPDTPFQVTAISR